MSGHTHEVRLTVNGEEVFESVEARKTLVEFLREDLGLTGSHVGCEHGVCGACTLLLDGAIVRGCLLLAVQCDGSRVDTIEGVADSGSIADLQRAFATRNALQCGFCTPGMLLTAAQLLDGGGVPTREKIRAQLSGNYCRCTGYHAIVDAIESVARARAKIPPLKGEGRIAEGDPGWGRDPHPTAELGPDLIRAGRPSGQARGQASLFQGEVSSSRAGEQS